MEIAFKIRTPSMPNILTLEAPPQKRGLVGNESVVPVIAVASLTEEQAFEFADIMKKEFMNHWRELKNKENDKSVLSWTN